MSSLKIVATGDLHFGNPRIDSELLYQKLVKYFFPEVWTSQLVLINGDVYDQLTTVSSSANKFVSKFIHDLFLISASTGIQIRILHGTYSHDRDQLKIFSSLDIPNCRMKIINEIYCEEITDLRNGDGKLTDTLKILYIPDNLPYKKSSDVIEHIKKIYKVIGWNKCDVVLGHGTFTHALPCSIEHGPACMYTIEQFKDLIDEQDPVIMGHIHSPSRSSNVFYCGSFDRMSHGEEQSKGFYTFTRDNNIWKSKFIKNPEAILFYTIDIPETTPDEASMHFINAVNEKFPKREGYVRVINKSPEIRTLLSRICAQTFPSITYSSKSNDTDKLSIKIADISLDTFDDVEPNVNNLGDLVYQYLNDKQLLGQVTKETILDTVHSLITN